MLLNTYKKNLPQLAPLVKARRIMMVVACLWTALSSTAHAADIEITTAETSQQSVPQNQSLRVQGGGSVTTNALDTPAIIGSNTGEGGNTITLENGADVNTSRADDGTNDDSYGIRIYGTQTDNGILGLAGGGPLADGASNIIDVQNGATLSTSGKFADAIKVEDNNRITMEGAISTSGNTGNGIFAYSNNDIDLSGSINTSGSDGYGIISYFNSTIDISGSITTTGRNAYGIAFAENHSVDISGTINTSGEGAKGMHFLNDNVVTLSGAITTTGSNAFAIHTYDNNNVVHISGDISATGSNSYAIYSGVDFYSGESNTFHFLNGTSITGQLHNGDSDDNQTSYLSFGYAKDGNNQADLTAIDNTFNISLADSITSDSSGRWDGYFAGGTTTLNGTENMFRNIFVGAASFDNAAVPDGSDGAGNSQTANLSSIGGAVATLNVSQSIATNGVVTVGDDSTYNLYGSHTHTGTDLTVSGSGKLDISDGGELINNASGGTQSISDLTVTSGSGTLSGTNALEGVTNANIAGILNYNMASALTIDTMNLSGTLNQSSANTLTLTTFNVTSGDTASITGTGDGAVSLGTATANGDLTVSRAIATTGTFTLGADDIYSLSDTHTHTGTNFTTNGILDLAGGSFVNNASGGTQSINTLHVTSGYTGTVSGSATTNVTTANITGTIYSSGTLTADSLGIGSGGKADVYGATNVSGATSTDGLLNVYNGSTLTTDSLSIGSDGNTNIYSMANVSGETSTEGLLNVYSGSTLTTNSLGIGSDGNTNIYGTANVSGVTSTDGLLNIYNGSTLTTDSLVIESQGKVGVNGTLNSSTVFIDSNGSISGSGSIHGDLTNYGIITPGNSIGTLTVNGDVSFYADSSYAVELTRNTHDKLMVNGEVNINGGTVKTSLSRKLYTGKERWSIITATDGVNGKFDRLRGPNSATLSLGLDYSTTSVGIYVTRKPYKTFGTTANDQTVGGTLDTILPSAVNSGTDMEQFLIELDFDSTANQISEYLTALNPEMYSSFVNMEFLTSQEFAKDISTRMHQLRESNLHLNVSTNMQAVQNIAEESGGKIEQIRANRGWNLWAQTSGSIAENGGTESSGYDIKSGRITVGGDRQFNDGILVGAAMGINQSDLDYNLGNSSGDQQGIHAALYGDVRYNGFYINSILSYGDFSNDSEREMTIFDTTAEASFDGSTLSAQLGTGYDFTFSNWQVGPALEVGIARVEVDSFSESGNRSSLNLNIEEQSDKRLYERLGIKAASVHQIGSATLLPRLGFGWQHTNSDDATVDAYFSGYQDSMFTVGGASSPQDVFGGELGLTALIGDQLSLYTKFSTAFGDDYTNYGFSMGGDWKF